MSLVGIDVGSSSVKVAAYSENGELLSVASNDLTGLHPEPGSWEQDAQEVRPRRKLCCRWSWRVRNRHSVSDQWFL
jgi:sugar (pentulose or hexulose) kinase